ncbi:MAG: redoxin domain-containing protein [Cytophagales bacterium]|nr:redoxin domain-containing protein [Cytophagales bacterium]
MTLLTLLLIIQGLTPQLPVQNFTLTNVVTGTAVSLDTQYQTSGVAVLFTSNNCPFDRYYTDRVKSLISSYQGKIGFLLINSHVDPEEATDKMKAAYPAWGLSVPYLADKEQVAMDALGARRSPEVFLLKKVNGKYFVSFSGAIDDNPQASAAVTIPYLKNAMDNLLAGKVTDPAMVRAAGCSIRKK